MSTSRWVEANEASQRARKIGEEVDDGEATIIMNGDADIKPLESAREPKAH